MFITIITVLLLFFLISSFLSSVAMADDCTRSFVEVDLEIAVNDDTSSLPESLTPAQKSLQAALLNVADCRAKLEALGEPPEHEAIEEARSAIASIDDALSSELERIHLSPPSPDSDPQEWSAYLVRSVMFFPDTDKIFLECLISHPFYVFFLISSERSFCHKNILRLIMRFSI